MSYSAKCTTPGGNGRVTKPFVPKPVSKSPVAVKRATTPVATVTPAFQTQPPATILASGWVRIARNSPPPGACAGVNSFAPLVPKLGSSKPGASACAFSGVDEKSVVNTRTIRIVQERNIVNTIQK